MRLLLALLCLVSMVLSADPTCGGTYQGFQYTISSPNYPRDYTNDLHCLYRLVGDPRANCEQQFHLQFLDFYLKAADNCKGDYLQVGDKHIFCGNIVGLRKFTGKNNTLSVIFHSDEQENSKGFKILVTAVPCSLKLDPFKNRFYEEITENERFMFNTNDIRNGTYHRGIRKDDENDTSRSLTFLPQESKTASSVTLRTSEQRMSSPRVQIDLTLDDNTRINALTPPFLTQASGWNDSREKAQITSYLFLPPKNNTYPIKDKAFDDATVLTNKLLPPIKNPVTFSKVHVLKNSLSQAARDKSSNPPRKFAFIPPRSYGDPGVDIVDYDSQLSSSICDKLVPMKSLADGGPDLSERINYDLIEAQRSPAIGLGISANTVYDPRYGFITSNNNYPGNSYNPGGYYLGSYPNVNPLTANSGGSYNPPTEYQSGYPGGSYNPSISLLNYHIGGYNPSEIYSKYPNPGSSYNPVDYVPSYNPSISGIYPNSGWNNGWGVGQTGECCRVQSGRRFSIVSPGFPGDISTTNAYSCRYTITKSSPDVCRLRITLRYFNFGENDQYCTFGYAEIDGRRFCGCKTGESIQVLFTDYVAKSIFITYSGYPRSRFGGFFIDIAQESCENSGFYPSHPSNPSNPASSWYPQNPSFSYDPNNPVYPGYQRRRDVGNSTKGNIQSPIIFPPPVDLINPRIREKRNSGYLYSKPYIPFPSKNEHLIPDTAGRKSHERFFSGSCQNRIFFDWAIASKEAILRHVTCIAYNGMRRLNSRTSYLPPIADEINSVSTCEEMNLSQGVFESPLYPNNYPNNKKKCYRFNKGPGFCKIELYIKDFELEMSQGCSKDYFSFSGQSVRYCGRSLNKHRTVFDLTRANSLQVYFSSDSNGTGRGFNIGFTQLPCEVQANFKRAGSI